MTTSNVTVRAMLLIEGDNWRDVQAKMNAFTETGVAEIWDSVQRERKPGNKFYAVVRILEPSEILELQETTSDDT